MIVGTSAALIEVVPSPQPPSMLLADAELGAPLGKTIVVTIAGAEWPWRSRLAEPLVQPFRQPD